jgi:hypothetical protein
MLGNGFRRHTLPGHCGLVRAVADNRRKLPMGVAGNGLIGVQAWTSTGDPLRFFPAECARLVFAVSPARNGSVAD